MNTCDTCVHWKEQHRYWESPGGEHTCDHPKIIKGYNRDTCPVDGVKVEDDEGWSIVTGPKFGCVLWESKP